MAIGVLAFFVGFVLSCGVLLFLLWLARDHLSGRAPRLASHAKSPEGDDDWPNTTRLLPWLLAGFVAIIWLVPFNSIELNASLPIDLTLDRLVLPFVVVAWILALAAGGRAAPRYPLHLDTRRHRPVRGLRLPQRGARRRLPQPDA